MPNSPEGRPAVIGVGMVGGALARYLAEKGHDPILYDPPKGHNEWRRLSEATIFFVCVPTPFDKAKRSFDSSYVEAALELMPEEATVVIRSTVLPGTTERLQQARPDLRLAFNPEFLREKMADTDMCHPDRQLLGVTDQSAEAAEEIMAWLPPAPFTKIMPATAAEAVKYFGNAFLAMKVIFANQMYDLCQAVSADYDLVRECAAADPRIGDSHLKVDCDGYRGYGGACFPKDVRALIALGEMNGIDLGLLKRCEEINCKLTGDR